MMLEIRVGDMYGVSVDEINEQLSRGWLGAKVALANKTLDWKTYCLAEYSSTGTSGPFFRLCMHPPRLQPLCSQEAILYFHVDEVGFYEDSDLKSVYPMLFDRAMEISDVGRQEPQTQIQGLDYCDSRQHNPRVPRW